MIFSVCVSIKEIVAKGREFPWPRPESCLRCAGHRVWYHGFVPAFFDGFSEQILLRRYRCPECGCVIRIPATGPETNPEVPDENTNLSDTVIPGDCLIVSRRHGYSCRGDRRDSYRAARLSSLLQRST